MNDWPVEVIERVSAPDSYNLYPRDIFVYTPPGYQEGAEKYPVLYMHDGQNLWDREQSAHGGWKLDTTADRLITAGKMQPIIIVGIANTSVRAKEYVGSSAYYGFPEQRDEEFATTSRERNQDYMRFIVEEIKPMIDSRYRTRTEREFTGIAGSSFGAGASLLTAFTYPEVFARVGAVSMGNYPTDHSSWERKPFAVADYIIKEQLPGLDPKNQKIYLDCGTWGVDMVFHPFAMELNTALVEHGWQNGENLRFQIHESADHNEAAWAARAEEFLTFLYPYNQE